MATEMSHSCMAVNSGRWAMPSRPDAGIIWVRRAGRDGCSDKTLLSGTDWPHRRSVADCCAGCRSDAQGALLLIYPIYAAYLIRLASLLRAQQIAAIACQGQAEIATLPVSSQMRVSGRQPLRMIRLHKAVRRWIQQGVGIMTDRARHVLEPLTKPACCCCTACRLYVWQDCCAEFCEQRCTI